MKVVIMRHFLMFGLILGISLASSLAQNTLEQNNDNLRTFLRNRYNQDHRKVKVMFKKLHSTEEAKRDFPNFTFTDKQFERLIESNVKDYETWYLKVRKLWDDFKNKTIEWFPHLADLIEDFTENYLWHAKISESNIAKLTETKEKLEVQVKPYFKSYQKNSTARSKLISEANLSQIRSILESDVQLTGSNLKNYLKKYQLKHENLSNNVEFLLNRKLLAVAVAPNNFEMCVMSVDSEKEMYLESNDGEKLDAMKEHFYTEKCAAHEICSKLDPRTPKVGKKPADLKNELQPYIDWFNKVYDDREHEDNENIKDEIDETVFDLIEKALEIKAYSHEKIQCLIDYMKRTGSVDKIYSSELFFSKEKLDKVIETIINDYKKLY